LNGPPLQPRFPPSFLWSPPSSPIFGLPLAPIFSQRAHRSLSSLCGQPYITPFSFLSSVFSLLYTSDAFLPSTHPLSLHVDTPANPSLPLSPGTSPPKIPLLHQVLDSLFFRKIPRHVFPPSGFPSSMHLYPLYLSFRTSPPPVFCLGLYPMAWFRLEPFLRCPFYFFDSLRMWIEVRLCLMPRALLCRDIAFTGFWSPPLHPSPDFPPARWISF